MASGAYRTARKLSRARSGTAGLRPVASRAPVLIPWRPARAATVQRGRPALHILASPFRRRSGAAAPRPPGSAQEARRRDGWGRGATAHDDAGGEDGTSRLPRRRAGRAIREGDRPPSARPATQTALPCSRPRSSGGTTTGAPRPSCQLLTVARHLALAARLDPARLSDAAIRAPDDAPPPEGAFRGTVRLALAGGRTLSRERPSGAVSEADLMATFRANARRRARAGPVRRRDQRGRRARRRQLHHHPGESGQGGRRDDLQADGRHGRGRGRPVCRHLRRPEGPRPPLRHRHPGGGDGGERRHRRRRADGPSVRHPWPGRRLLHLLPHAPRRRRPVGGRPRAGGRAPVRVRPPPPRASPAIHDSRRDRGTSDAHGRAPRPPVRPRGRRLAAPAPRYRRRKTSPPPSRNCPSSSPPSRSASGSPPGRW